MAELSTAQPSAAVISARSYAPSLFDRYTDWVDQLAGSAGLFYAGFALALAGLQVAVQWSGGLGPIHAFPLVYILTIPYNLALMHYLDRVALDALAHFRPVLSISDADYDAFEYRLTTMPARPVLLAAVIGAAYGLWTLAWVPYPVKINELHFSAAPLSIPFNHAITPLMWAIIGVLIYHTIHQLRVVQQIYARCSSVDLFALRPLYAFSALSARTAIGVAAIVYIWYLCAPLLINIGSGAMQLVLISVFSLLTFVLPLRDAHRLLTDEKDRLLGENGERTRAAVAELHRRMDSGQLEDMDNLNKAMSSLELEHATLDRISTWPWKAETLRAVAAALFFPLIVWLSQWALQRLLGP